MPLLVGDRLSLAFLLTTDAFLFLFFRLFHYIFCLFLEGFCSKLVGGLRFTGEGGRLLSGSSSSS